MLKVPSGLSRELFLAFPNNLPFHHCVFALCKALEKRNNLKLVLEFETASTRWVLSSCYICHAFVTASLPLGRQPDAIKRPQQQSARFDSRVIRPCVAFSSLRQVLTESSSCSARNIILLPRVHAHDILPSRLRIAASSFHSHPRTFRSHLDGYELVRAFVKRNTRGGIKRFRPKISHHSVTRGFRRVGCYNLQPEGSGFLSTWGFTHLRRP